MQINSLCYQQPSTQITINSYAVSRVKNNQIFPKPDPEWGLPWEVLGITQH